MNFKDIIGPDELDWKVIPLDWKKIGKNELKLGTPVSKDGLEANDASCYGILMDDVEKGKHFQARVIVSGCVDFAKAEEYSGVKISEEAKNAIGKVWSQAGGGLAELPDGVPYVETIYDEWGTVTVVADAESSSCEVTFYDNEGSIRVIEAGKKYRAIFDGKEYICTGADKSLYTWFSADGSNVVSETCPFYFKTAESAANHRKLSVYEAGQHTFSVAEIVEEVHPVDMRCLPEGYPYKEQSAIEWDGNADGLVSFNMGPTVLHKVSDKVLTSTDLIGTKIFFSGTDVENGEFFEQVTVDNTMVREEGGAVIIAIEIPNSNIELFALASLPVAVSENMPAGTYFGMLSDDDNLVYTSKVPTETIFPMFGKFLPRTTVRVAINEDDMSATSNMTYAEINALINSGNIVKADISLPLGVLVLNYCGCAGNGTLSFCTPWVLDPYNSTGIDVFFVNISSDDSIDFKWFKASGTWGP